MTEENEDRGWQWFLNSIWQRVSDSFPDTQHLLSTPSSASSGCEGSGNEERGKNTDRANCESFCSFKIDFVLKRS